MTVQEKYVLSKYRIGTTVAVAIKNSSSSLLVQDTFTTLCAEI